MPAKRFIHFLMPAAVLAVFFIFMASGCKKDELNTDSSFQLSFSHDTVLFDTVFTSIGTVTQKLLVHNTSNKKVIVKAVKLAGGNDSPFRINIDGVSAFQVNDLEIGAKDSIYIFVKVTINPNEQNAPFVKTDSILFETNGNVQNVKLVAWGQNAIFYNNCVLKGNIVLGPDKPHVIFGLLTADSLCTITIEAGTKLYFHNKSGLLIRNGASINVNGTLENPVTFRGDRLGTDYSTVAGQWLGIEIEGGSHNNQFIYADIQNGQIGLLVDSSGITSQPLVTLYNCIIHNMVNYGILAIHTNILAANCQITNCGGYTVAIQNGGKCDFRQCTISNFWTTSSRHFPTLLLSNYLMYEGGQVVTTPLENAFFGNCIINGSGDEEFEPDSLAAEGFHYTFDHCLVQTTLQASHQSSFIECIINQDAKFIDPWKGDFQLDTLSAAKDIGSLTVITTSPLPITLDMKGISRIPLPDLGVYERVESK